MDTKPQCNLVVAGPGGGKTHNMVQKVLESMERLHPTRFCVVITYTNTATEEIKLRLFQKGKIPANVFIGTIHGFLNQFIFEPFAKIKGIIREDYCLIDKVKLHYQASNPFARKNAEASKSNDLVNKGIVTYDKLLEKSKELIDDVEIAKRVANRLQYVFIDEYQDVRLWQHDIFMKIFDQNKTHFYCIGDPLQSIFKFTYIHTQNLKEKAPENLNDTPIFLLENKFGRCNDFQQVNRRSRPNIIDLIHKYTCKIGLTQQKYLKATDVPVFFIDCGKNRNKVKGVAKVELDFETKKEIFKQFNSLIQNYNIEKEHKIKYKIVLVDEGDTIRGKQTELNSIELSKDKHKETSYFQEYSRCILGVIGCRLSEIIDKKDLKEVLKYRKFCLHIIKNIINTPEDQRVAFIQNKFKTEFKRNIGSSANNVDMSKSLNALIIKHEDHLIHEKEESLFFSTIHSAKGLEATCVLVIAKTNNELETWLDFEQSSTSHNDNYRLGYVAFSRARELLCIACLETISENLIKKILELNIKFMPEKTN